MRMWLLHVPLATFAHCVRGTRPSQVVFPRIRTRGTEPSHLGALQLSDLDEAIAATVKHLLGMLPQRRSGLPDAV
jgi:uncharacterized protein (DUF1810 family)